MHPILQILDPSSIRYQGETLKTVHGKTPIRLLGIHHNMWLDAKTQRRKVIDAAIEVAAYLYKNDNLRIDPLPKVFSICLPSLFSFSAPLIDWPNLISSYLPQFESEHIRTLGTQENVQQSVSLPFLGRRADFRSSSRLAHSLHRCGTILSDVVNLTTAPGKC